MIRSNDCYGDQLLFAVDKLEIARDMANSRLERGNPRRDFHQSSVRMRQLIMRLNSLIDLVIPFGMQIAEILLLLGTDMVRENASTVFKQVMCSGESEISKIRADMELPTRDLADLDHRVREKENEVTRCVRRLREISEQARVNDSVESYDMMRSLYGDYARKFKNLEFVNFELRKLKLKKCSQMKDVPRSSPVSKDEIIIPEELL